MIIKEKVKREGGSTPSLTTKEKGLSRNPSSKTLSSGAYPTIQPPQFNGLLTSCQRTPSEFDCDIRPRSEQALKVIRETEFIVA